jgi:cytidylate kinase
MPGVTISAQYGAGGSVVAPAVAKILQLPLLDRAISSEVAAKLRVTVREAEGGELKRSPADRFLSVLRPLAGGVVGAGTDAAPDPMQVDDDAAPFREQAELIMKDAMDTGAVILGRAGSAAFRDWADVLRVRLFGPAEARIAQAARVEHTDPVTARRRLPEVDRARSQYVRRLYGVDIDNGSLYHLQIDSTAIPPEVCADLIVRAYESLVQE